MSQTERTERGPAKGRRERAEVPPERRAAARRQIRTLGDPVLREQARPVDKFDDELATLSRRMIAVMHDAPGVGLAATQGHEAYSQRHDRNLPRARHLHRRADQQAFVPFGRRAKRPCGRY